MILQLLRKKLHVGVLFVFLIFSCKKNIHQVNASPKSCISYDFWLEMSSSTNNTGLLSSLIKIQGEKPLPPIPCEQIHLQGNTIHYRVNLMRKGRNPHEIVADHDKVIKDIDHSELSRYGYKLLNYSIADEFGDVSRVMNGTSP